MRKIVLPKLGGPEVLTVAEVDTPKPGPDQVLVKLTYAGITFGDVYQREGTYRANKQLSKEEAPLSIGNEGAGTVAAVGTNVKDLKEGDTVVYCETPNSYAEYVAVPAFRAMKVPPGIPLETAAAAYALGCTAHYLAYDTGKLKPGMSCLVHAGAGALGHLLIQFAKILGAKVMTTVGSEEKAAFARKIGADEVVLYRQADFLEAAKKWGDGKGFDVVYDSVGKDTFDRSVKAVRPKGLMVLYGNSSGMVESVNPMDLAAAGSIFFTRPRFNHHMQTPADVKRRTDDLFSAISSGKMHVELGRVFPLDQVVEAHRHLESRAGIGKILLSAG